MKVATRRDVSKYEQRLRDHLSSMRVINCPGLCGSKRPPELDGRPIQDPSALATPSCTAPMEWE